MGAAIPLAIKAVAWIGGAAWGATSSGALWLGAARIAITAATVAYSAKQQKKLKNSLSSLREQGTTFTVTDPLAARKLIYGEVRTGGVTLLAHTNGVKNEYAHFVIALAKRPVSEIGVTYFGDESLGNPWGSGNSPDSGSRYYNYAWVYKERGETGVANADLISAAPEVWTSDHKLVDIANLYVRLLYNSDVYSSGASFNMSTMVKGHAVFDSRISDTLWSENPALIARDYLVNEMGVSTSEVDDDGCEAAANICDETVLDADGNSRKRYTCNIVLSTSDSPRDNLNKIARCMAGWVKKIGGKWRFNAGAHKSSSLSLTLADLRGPIQFQTNDEPSQSCNGVRATFLSPENNWQGASAPAVIKIVTAPNITAGAQCTILSVGTTNFTAIGAASNTVGVTFVATGAGTGTGTVDPYLGADNGVRRWRDLDLHGCTNQPEAIRREWIELQKARHELTIVAPLMFQGFKVQPGDYVDWTVSEFGWSGKLAEVTRQKHIYQQQENGLAIGFDIVTREVSSSIYSRTAADETTEDPAPNTDKQDAFDVDEPTIVDVTSDDDELLKLPDGTVISRIHIEWSITDPYVLDGGAFEIEYKLSDSSVWISVPASKGTDTDAWIPNVIDGEDYDIRIRAVNGAGVHSEWVEQLNYTVIGKTEDPGEVTDFDAEGIPGGVLLMWTPPPDKDIKLYRIYYADTNSQPSEFVTVDGGAISATIMGLAAGTWYFWIVTEDTTEHLSDVVGSVNADAESSSGPTYVFGGEFDTDAFYSDNDKIKSYVRYSGNYYVVNNPAKDELDTWGTPGGGDWEAFVNLPPIAATDLLLTKDIIVTRKMTLGDGSTADAGQIVTHGVTGFGTGADGIFLGIDGSDAKIYVGEIAGQHFSYEPGAIELIAGYIELGSASYPVIIDIDSSFVGPNPPARLTFGSLQITSTSGGKTTQTITDGGIAFIGGTNFTIGYNFAGNPYYINSNDGVGSFASLLLGSSGDVNLYRSAANMLKTDDDLTVGGGDIFIGSDCSIYRASSNVLQTDDEFHATLGIVTSSIAADNAGTFEFFAGVGFAAVYVRNQNFEVRNSSGTAKFTVDPSSGSITTDGTITTGNSGILIGADCSIFRNGANILETGDGLIVGGNLITQGTLATAATLQLGNDCTISRTGANVIETGSGDAFIVNGAFGVNAASQFNDDLTVTLSGVEKFKVNHSTGAVSIQGTQVLSTRHPSTPVTAADAIAVLQHHGLCN